MPDPINTSGFGRRALGAFLVCILGVVMLGAGSPESASRFGRLGHTMMCVCGCSQILLECNHVGCPDSERMIGELRDQMASPNGAGADSLILNWFVAKYGATVLAAPIRGGFDTVAWVVPLTIFILAIFGTAWMVKIWTNRRRMALVGAPPAVRPVDDDMRARIRKDTEYR